MRTVLIIATLVMGSACGGTKQSDCSEASYSIQGFWLCGTGFGKDVVLFAFDEQQKVTYQWRVEGGQFKTESGPYRVLTAGPPMVIDWPFEFMGYPWRVTFTNADTFLAFLKGREVVCDRVAEADFNGLGKLNH